MGVVKAIGGHFLVKNLDKKHFQREKILTEQFSEIAVKSFGQLHQFQSTATSLTSDQKLAKMGNNVPRDHHRGWRNSSTTTTMKMKI